MKRGNVANKMPRSRGQHGRGEGRGRGHLSTPGSSSFFVENGVHYPIMNQKPEKSNVNAGDMTDQNPENRRFEDACAMIQESVQRYISTHTDEPDLSEEEESLNSDGIVQKILISYPGQGTDLERTQQFLQDTLKSGACICLICIESIKRTESIWSCRACYCIFHLPCIQKWSKDSVYHLSLTLDENNAINDQLKWCCPKCRESYNQADRPSRYTCFCGKTVDPLFDPWLVPHACGSICSKNLQPECGHTCLLLCHPGPCPPCPKTVQALCYCGKQKPQTRRCSNKQWSCGHPCRNLLSCGQHKCDQLCHSGTCAPCPRQSEQKCNCGKQTKLRPCASARWQCQAVCKRPLSCGYHSCEEVCHAAECGVCPRSGTRTCPCGKSVLQLPCTEDTPTCGDTCGKLLECSVHRCSQRCHFGSCGTCVQMRTKLCRCGSKEKSLPCCKEYLCETKCRRFRDCNKHPCSRKCCDGNCPPCEKPCTRTLNCKNHKCSSRCHKGPCYPCRLTVDVCCSCGSTKRTVPCGRERVTKPPRCHRPCTIPPDCHHPFRLSHQCHFDHCPPCQQICSKQLGCGHICPECCHSAVLMMIVPQQYTRVGPWEPPPVPRMEIVNQPCPPCIVPVPVTCIGKHVTHDFHCHEALPWSCGRPCGRQLLCENHLCALQCHAVSNAQNDQMAGDNCQSCEEPCSQPRHPECVHPCLQPCHPGVCPPCTQPLKLRCHCQLGTLYIPCDAWTQAGEQARNEKLSCGNRCPKELPCGHRCPKTCHPGDCGGQEICKKRVAVRCACKRLKQEHVCHTLMNRTVLVQCDDVCHEAKERALAAKAAEEERKTLEEKHHHEKELEEFKRKQEGRKRRRRKSLVVESEKWWKPYLRMGIVPALAVLILSFIYYRFFW